MVKAGMIYKATPPLYSVKVAGKDKFFVDNIDMIKYNQKIFSQKFSLKDNKKNPITGNNLTLFFVRNADYVYFLDSLADTYAIEKPLFEDVLTNYVDNGMKVNFDKLQKLIKSKYRFVNVYKDGKTIIVQGVITKSNIIVLSEKFFKDCNPIIKIMSSNDTLHYTIDNKAMSLYEIMKLYEKTQPNGVHRYKGLGETSENILEKAVMNPLGDRVLIQYTMDDIKDTIETIRSYESDKKKILALTGTISRDDLIE